MTARRLEITADLIRRYSRRGNFHSDAETARALGLPGLVAQGAHVAGPAYGLLLDTWGDAFLEQGELDLRFVGIVLAGDTVDATVEVDGDEAVVTVENTTHGRTAVVGRAWRRSR